MADGKMDLSNLNEIEDEEKLHKMINDTSDFDERKKIRGRLKELREKRSVEFEKRRKAAEEARENAIKERQRLANEEKERKLKEYKEKAQQPRIESNYVEDSIRKRQKEADEQKAKKLASYSSPSTTDKKVSEETVSRSSKSETTTDGKKRTTTVTTTTTRIKGENNTVTKQTKQITQVGGVGGTGYKMTKVQSPDDVLEKITNKLEEHSLPGTHGRATVRTEHWNCRKGTTVKDEKTKMWTAKLNDGQDGAAGAAGGPVVQRSASTIKQVMLEWCKSMTKDYEHVDIRNFSNSWNDGMAFCALIHHFYPRTFDFKRLNPKARRANFTLAFTVAEKEADIAPLLDVDDMVRMKNPDWKCVFTYVQSFYRRFRNWDEESEKKKREEAEKKKEEKKKQEEKKVEETDKKEENEQ
ncbi:DgyrCDS9412 [Dimorphilus gyrociliatus]|uniref:DgyrCDS9412 n=1 Tax=Dimorphilus gyrociliatus TaxID=2664684 RepID=A0A7I8VXA1_9ANNE|nr:DgyrCDS9412 [Dimorphilus gyrociliatus]